MEHKVLIFRKITELMHCFTVFPFFLQYLTNAEYMISSWSGALKTTLMIPNNFPCIWS